MNSVLHSQILFLGNYATLSYLLKHLTCQSSESDIPLFNHCFSDWEHLMWALISYIINVSYSPGKKLDDFWTCLPILCIKIVTIKTLKIKTNRSFTGVIFFEESWIWDYNELSQETVVNYCCSIYLYYFSLLNWLPFDVL